jgi:SAM-dependent methyltransferase
VSADATAPVFWHHGLVARWWTEFETDGPEIAYFQQLIARFGQPALDAGCGTGRLLLPALQAGLDVDGADAAPDMLAGCRERAARLGVAPSLFEQPLHALDLPRRYGTIFVCGSLGIGGGRDLFERSIARLRAHLAPGGALVVDKVAPPDAGGGWATWARRRRGGLPEDWPEAGDTRRAADGSTFELRSRLTAIDEAERVTTRELRVTVRDAGGRVVAEETHALLHYIYFEDELVAAFRAAGLADVQVEEAYRMGDSPVRVVIGRG